MAAEEAAYRAAHTPAPAAAATKTDAVVPSDAPAVEAATDLANQTQAEMANGIDTPAEEGAGNDGPGEQNP
jgi:penicillin-binding protein 2